MAVKKKKKPVKASPRSEVENMAKDPENADRYSGRGRWTATEVMAAVLLSASEEEALERLARMAPSKIVMRHAALRLNESAAHEALAALLEKHARDRGFTLLNSDGAGGKKCPLSGESRIYSVQSSRRGPKLYISLPVNCLEGVVAGARVVAVFNEGTIRVEAEAG